MINTDWQGSTHKLLQKVSTSTSKGSVLVPKDKYKKGTSSQKIVK